MRTVVSAFLTLFAIACRQGETPRDASNQQTPVAGVTTAGGKTTVPYPECAGLDIPDNEPNTVNIVVRLDDAGGNCDVFCVYPDNADVGWNSRIVWNVTNNCEHRLNNLRIEGRKPKYPKNGQGDPLDRDPRIQTLDPEQTASMEAKVLGTAVVNLYKYVIKGSHGIDVDPEIDVRGAVPPPIEPARRESTR